MPYDIHIAVCVPPPWTRIGPPQIPLLDEPRIDGLIYGVDDGVAELESVIEGHRIRAPDGDERRQSAFEHDCLNEFYVRDLHQAVRRATATGSTPQQGDGYKVLATPRLLAPHYRKYGRLVRAHCIEGINGHQLRTAGLSNASLVQVLHDTTPANGALSAHERLTLLAALRPDLDTIRTHLHETGERFAPGVQILS